MIFTDTSLKGAVVIDPEPLEDDRGFFARTWCEREFRIRGLNSRLVQCSISYNEKRGTLRGMHYQAKPFEETRLVRCTAGAIYDVIIDLRPDSPTYMQWMSLTLTARNHTMLYIPGGFAHGFQTLEDDVEVFYQMSEVYVADAARGVRWDDSAFGIDWPAADRVLSERDRAYPDFVPPGGALKR